MEEAADWVTHAVQLPEDVAEAFRSNSVSGYDFPELIENNGEGLHFDLGIKWNYRKRIVKVGDGAYCRCASFDRFLQFTLKGVSTLRLVSGRLDSPLVRTAVRRIERPKTCGMRFFFRRRIQTLLACVTTSDTWHVCFLLKTSLARSFVSEDEPGTLVF